MQIVYRHKRKLNFNTLTAQIALAVTIVVGVGAVYGFFGRGVFSDLGIVAVKIQTAVVADGFHLYALIKFEPDRAPDCHFFRVVVNDVNIVKRIFDFAPGRRSVVAYDYFGRRELFFFLRIKTARKRRADDKRAEDAYRDF